MHKVFLKYFIEIEYLRCESCTSQLYDWKWFVREFFHNILEFTLCRLKKWIVKIWAGQDSLAQFSTNSLWPTIKVIKREVVTEISSFISRHIFAIDLGLALVCSLSFSILQNFPLIVRVGEKSLVVTWKMSADDQSHKKRSSDRNFLIHF